MKRTILWKTLILIGMLAILGACSDYSKEEKKAYKALMKYVKEEYPESNKELEVVYPKLKEIPPAEFIEGKTTQGELIFMFRGNFTYNPEKVSSAAISPGDGTGVFDVHVEKINGKYEVTYFTESARIRTGFDE